VKKAITKEIIKKKTFFFLNIKSSQKNH